MTITPMITAITGIRCWRRVRGVEVLAQVKGGWILHGRTSDLAYLTIGSLAAIAILGVVGSIILAVLGKEQPPLLAHLASAAAGAIGSYLVRVPMTAVAKDGPDDRAEPPKIITG